MWFFWTPSQHKGWWLRLRCRADVTTTLNTLWNIRVSCDDTHTHFFQNKAHILAYIWKSPLERGVLIPISSLLFHTAGARACYSSYEGSLRSAVPQLPLCNQPLWLFCTQRAVIGTFTIALRCCWHTSFVRTVSEIPVKQGRKWP